MRTIIASSLLFTLVSCQGQTTKLPSVEQSSLKEDSPRVTFQNPVAQHGADPWVVQKDGYYYWCGSDGNSRIFVHKSKRLQDIGTVNGALVWQAPANTDFATGTWAPEMHYVQGKWYIYVAASNGPNERHRMFVLEAKTDNPQDGFEMKGQIKPFTDEWAIDGTVYEDGDKLYFIWSGWANGANDSQQNLYIAPMENPWTIQSGNPLIQRIEAEHARRHRAQLHNTARASGSQVVGEIDFDDSSVEFDVDVPEDGKYQLDIRYANGSRNDIRSNSSHRLYVNNEQKEDVVYPYTAWGNFQVVSDSVNLRKGHNVLKLAKGHDFAEIDLIEIKRPNMDRVMISSPTESWERFGGRAPINEGPEILKKDGKVHIIYSASGSWSDDYRLAQLTLDGKDPMNPKSWRKVGEVFTSANAVYGPGHASFTKSPDGKEDWIIYHAARNKGSGWDRNVRIQKFGWKADGSPDFGSPLSLNTIITAPSE